MAEAKVSVIIPVYRVENYLRRCLDSVRNQTLGELQIILVDDGSPDGSGAICDEYAALDERISVIHKDNGGLSSARNAGLEMAVGEWIAYVDSDDWIEADMLAFLLEQAEAAGADVAVCGHYEDYPGRSVRIGVERRMLLNAEEALGLLLYDRELNNYAWNKLWRRRVLEGLRFPEGRNFEDIATTYAAFLRSERILCLPEAKYHYVQRSDSIVGNPSLKNRFDYYDAVMERRAALLGLYPQFRELLDNSCMKAVISIWGSVRGNPPERRAAYRERLEEAAAFAANHWKGALGSSLGAAGKAVLCLTPSASPLSFWAAGLVSRIFALRHGRPL